MSIAEAIASAKIQLPDLRSCCHRDLKGRPCESWFGKLFAEAGLAGARFIKHCAGGAFRLAMIPSILGGVSREPGRSVFSLQSELPSSHDDGRSLFADGRERADCAPRLVPLTIFGSLVSVVIPIVIVVTITAVA